MPGFKLSRKAKADLKSIALCTGGLTPTPKSQGSQKRRQLLNISGR